MHLHRELSERRQFLYQIRALNTNRIQLAPVTMFPHLSVMSARLVMYAALLSGDCLGFSPHLARNVPLLATGFPVSTNFASFGFCYKQ